MIVNPEASAISNLRTTPPEWGRLLDLSGEISDRSGIRGPSQDDLRTLCDATESIHSDRITALSYYALGELMVPLCARLEDPTVRE